MEQHIKSARGSPDSERIEAALAEDEDLVIEPEKRWYRRIISLLKSWEEQKNFLESFCGNGHRLGSVLAGFSLLTTKNAEMVKDIKPSILDWALVRINPERTTDETHVSKLQFHLATTQFPQHILFFTFYVC